MYEFQNKILHEKYTFLFNFMNFFLRNPYITWNWVFTQCICGWPDLRPMSPVSRDPPVKQPGRVCFPLSWLRMSRSLVCLLSDLLPSFADQKGELVLWCLTASSLRPPRLSSTMWRSCLKASCARCACAGTARRRTRGAWPTRRGERASRGKPGASGARSWPKTTRTWPLSSSPSPVMTFLCSELSERYGCPLDGHCRRPLVLVIYIRLDS